MLQDKKISQFKRLNDEDISLDDLLPLVDLADLSETGVISIDQLKRFSKLTRSEVKELYEQNPDTNAFTNALKAKLEGIDLSGYATSQELNNLQGQINDINDTINTPTDNTPPDRTKIHGDLI